MLEINDSHLLMYLDGTSDPERKKIIEKNEQHQSRLKFLGDLQSHLEARLYRSNCPDSLTLGEYYFENLSSDAKEWIKKHLQECPYCTQEIAELAEFLKPSWVRRVVAWLVSGKDAGGTGELVPALQVRGEGDGILVYQADEAQIVVDLQTDRVHPGYQAIIGLITGIEASNYEVVLWQETGEMVRSHVDELGNFVMDRLKPGEYELEIKGPKIEIQIQKFLIT